MNPLVFVLNSSHPEVDHLAAGLCRRGLLGTYVRRYTKQDRWWERLLNRTPIVSKVFKESYRRNLPIGLDSARISDAGVVSDLLAAAIARLPGGSQTHPFVESLRSRRDQAIVRLGAKLGANARIAVGNYSVAAELFEAVKANGGTTVLNYPTAHHTYFNEMLQEEAELEPLFADSLNRQMPSPDESERLEIEVSLADHIMVGSTFARDTFVGQGIPAEKVQVITYGAEMQSHFHPRTAQRTDAIFRVIFAGQLTQRKGISYLFRAIEKIKGPDLELVLAGREAGSPEAFEFYRHVYRHLGDLSQAELAEAFRSSDVLVLPSLIEGMGLVVLQAMACGVPVIVTANGPGDLVRDGIDGFVIPIRDADAIADRIEVLRADKDLREEMGKAARERALEFSWARFENQAANWIEQMV